MRRSGQIVATRTRWWRFYDFMWGLHIMDPKTREDTHNPFVIRFGIVALAMSVLGTDPAAKGAQEEAQEGARLDS